MNVTDYNNHPVDDVYAMTVAEILQTIFLSGVCIFGTVGNLLVVTAVSTTRSLQARHNVFIVSLAIVDLVTTALLTPFFMLTLVRGGWPYSDGACTAIGYLTILCLTTSGLTVNCIAVGRYLTVANTSHVRRKRVHGRFIILASALLLAILLINILLPIFGIGAVGYNVNLAHCTASYTNTAEWAYTAFMFLIGLACTLTIVPISYGLIFCVLRKSRISIQTMTLSGRRGMDNNNDERPKTAAPPASDESAASTSPDALVVSTTTARSASAVSRSRWREKRQESQERKMMSGDELRLTKKLLLLFGVFLFCWMPYTSVVLADRDLMVPQAWHRATNSFMWINSALNAYLYAWMIPSYRQAYKRLILKLIYRKGNLFV